MKLKVIVNLVLLLFVTFFISSGEAKETEKKIYVSRDQIVITKDGILAYVDGAKTPIPGKTLSFDDNGMYIKEWKGPCWLHDLWCNRCGGCGVLLCPMNCSCYD